MASVCSDSNIVSVSCETRTLILGLSSSEVRTFLHSDINKNNISCIGDDSSTPNKVQNESEEIGLGLACCGVSSCGKQLAFCTLAKNLCIVNLGDGKPSVVRVFHLIRGASKVRFTPINNHVVVADKSGDVYQFKPEKDDDQGQLILGHLSLLLDVLVTPDEKYIITCDRDEKIRISSYPNGYNIVAYCLGHTEFVSSVSLLPHNTKHLISTSGDGTIRFWNYISGVELAVCNTSQCFNLEKVNAIKDVSEGNIAAITSAATTIVNSSSSLICVAVDNFSACLVFRCTTESDGIHCNLIQNISLENCYLWSLSFSSSILWLILGTGDSLLLRAKSLNFDLCKFDDDVPPNIFKAVEVFNNENLKSDKKNNVVNLLFKRKFENVQDYLRKKEQRLFVQEPPNKKCKA